MFMFFKHVAMKERDWFNSLSHGSMDIFTVALLAMEACKSSFSYFSTGSKRIFVALLFMEVRERFLALLVMEAHGFSQLL
jgi:hypothetical protein